MTPSISRLTRAEIFLFTLTRTVINAGYRMVYPLLTLFAAGMSMRAAELSIAFSVRSVLGAFNPFLASLVNARGHKNGLVLGAALFFISCGITAVGQNFPSFIIGLSVFGVSGSDGSAFNRQNVGSYVQPGFITKQFLAGMRLGSCAERWSHSARAKYSGNSTSRFQ